MSFLDQAINRERLSYPLQEIGIGGFKLFARVSDSLTLNAENPINFVEDGTPLNDHRIQRPEVITISGSIGDVYRSPESLVNRFQSLTDNLGVITQYTPQLTSVQATKALQIADQIDNRLSEIEGVVTKGTPFNSIFGNQDTNSKPLGEQFIDTIESIHYGNQLISIEMAYRIYDNMSLRSVIIERDNTSNGINFSIEAERFRIADLSFVEVEKITKAPAKSVAKQAETEKDKGVQEGKQATENDLNQSALREVLNTLGVFKKEQQ